MNVDVEIGLNDTMTNSQKDIICSTIIKISSRLNILFNDQIDLQKYVWSLTFILYYEK